jgi:hypothetical protein
MPTRTGNDIADAIRGLDALIDSLHADNNFQLFRERLRHWKTRTRDALSRVAGPAHADRFARLRSDFNSPESYDSVISTHRAFLTALAEELPHALSTVGDAAAQPSTLRPLERLFLSHASSDRAVAEFIKTELERCIPGLVVFQTSVPGMIPAGADWLATIKAELDRADGYLVLSYAEKHSAPVDLVRNRRSVDEQAVSGNRFCWST